MAASRCQQFTVARQGETMKPDEYRNLAERLRDHVQDVDKLGYLARQSAMHPNDIDNDVHRIKEWMKDGVSALHEAADALEVAAHQQSAEAGK